jgi:hypothetical protein
MTNVSPQATPPIRLVVESQGQGVRLQVVGSSDHAVEATYALDVTSDAEAGGNRTVQRGRASLRPGAPVTLMTLTLGNIARGRWIARLRVDPVDAPTYEDIRSGPEA